jgi:hypothetical protein
VGAESAIHSFDVARQAIRRQHHARADVDQVRQGVEDLELGGA